MCSIFLEYGVLFSKLLVICDFFVLQGEDYSERRDLENFYLQMVNGGDYFYFIGIIQIIFFQIIIENEKEMIEEVKAIGNLKCLFDYIINFFFKNGENKQNN